MHLKAFLTMPFEISRDKRRSLDGRNQSSSRKYDYDGYSEYESRGPTPFSEYDRSAVTDGRHTAFSEYTDGDRTPYTGISENESGKQTPYSEYATEYTYGTYDDRNPGTLGIERNQYCTQLNGVFGVNDSMSDEDSHSSSYSQSYSESDYDQLCDANVNTNCMNTLFNRNTDANVPGTINCGKSGPSEDVPLKMTLPLPLQYMDHFVPSKNDLNTVLETFTKKCDNDHEKQVFPQIYKSLFEAASDASGSSEEDREDRQETQERVRSRGLKSPRASRGPQAAFNDNREDRLDSPPSHIIISDEASAVSSADSFGFAAEREKSDFTRKKKARPNMIDADFKKSGLQYSSPRHRHAAQGPLPAQSKQVQSPKSPHGLDRIMGNQVGSPRNRNTSEVVSSPRNRFSNQHIVPNGTPGVLKQGAFARNRGSIKDAGSPRKSSAENEISSARERHAGHSKSFFGRKENSTKGKQSKDSYVDQLSSPNVDEKRQSPRKQGRQAAPSSYSPLKSNLGGSNWVKGQKAQLDDMKEESPSFDERRPSSDAVKTTSQASSWKNSASSIPPTISYGAACTAYSDLTSEFGDFGNRGKTQTPLQASSPTARKHHNRHAESHDATRDELMHSKQQTPPMMKEACNKREYCNQTQDSDNDDKLHTGEVEASNWCSKPKKAETLETIEDALMVPRKSKASAYKIKDQELHESGITGDGMVESGPARLPLPSAGLDHALKGDELIRSPATPPTANELDIEGDELMGRSDPKQQNPNDSLEPGDGDALMGGFSPTSMNQRQDAEISRKECEDDESVLSPTSIEEAGEADMTDDQVAEPLRSELSMYPQTLSDYCNDITDGKKDNFPQPQHRTALNPISDLESQISNLESQISKLEQESEVPKLQHSETIGRHPNTLGFQKQTDATLVTAPTAITMETPFTFDTPLVSSPTFTAMDTFDPESHSKRFVATSVALPIHIKRKDSGETITVFSFYIILVQETKKCLTELLIIIVAWARHFTPGHNRRRGKGGMEIGLFLPTLDDSNVIQEHAIQGRPLVFYRLPSLCSDEPGMFLEAFAPNIEATTDSKGRLSVYNVFLPSKKSSIWPRIFQQSVEISTSIWETEPTYSDKCDQYEEFGFWNE